MGQSTGKPGTFTRKKELGSGASATVYNGKYRQKKVAIKTVSLYNGYFEECVQNELRAYNQFDERKSKTSRVPRLYTHRQGSVGHYSFVMEKLGPSLDSLHRRCGGKFSHKTLLMLAAQLIECVHWMHERNVLHRDIRPNNFLMGTGKKRSFVYVIDFGASSPYLDDGTKRHVEHERAKCLVSTPLFASVNANRCFTQSRKDDIIAIGHMLAFLGKGTLPWEATVEEEDSVDLVTDKMVATSVEDTCRGLPLEIRELLDYGYSLEFEERPDYKLLLGKFRAGLRRDGYVDDRVFDWTEK